MRNCIKGPQHGEPLIYRNLPVTQSQRDLSMTLTHCVSVSLGIVPSQQELVCQNIFWGSPSTRYVTKTNEYGVREGKVEMAVGEDQ